jgi:hypothetical protein
VAESEVFVNRKRSLEIDEDIAFQKREWFYQRIGIGLLFAFVLAAVLGFTGMGGPMNRVEAGERGSALRIEYERVVRRGSLSTVKLHLHAPPGEFRFWVGAPYFEDVRIESVAPAPELVSVENGRHVYVLRSGSADVTVVVQVEHQTVGRIHGEIGIVGGPSVRFNQVALF